MAAGAALGAIWSCAALFAEWTPLSAALLHWVICPFMICRIGCCTRGIKQTVKAEIYFLLAAVTTGGAMNAVYGVSNKRQSFTALLLTMLFVQMIILVLLRMTKKEERNKTLFCEVELKFHEKTVMMIGLWDTGNRLCSLTKRPVHLIDQIGAEMLLKPEDIDRLMKLESEETEDCFIEGKLLYRVPFCGIGMSNDWLFAFEIDQMKVKRSGREVIVSRPVIGVSKTLFCKGKDYRMILNPQDI